MPAFFSANSAQKPNFSAISKTEKEAEFNYKLGLQLLYYVRHQSIGPLSQSDPEGKYRFLERREDLEKELNDWIRQYVVIWTTHLE